MLTVSHRCVAVLVLIVAGFDRTLGSGLNSILISIFKLNYLSSSMGVEAHFDMWNYNRIVPDAQLQGVKSHEVCLGS